MGSAPYITSLQSWIRSSASTRAGWSVTIIKLSICVCDSSVLISALWKPPILRGNFCEIRQPACFSVLPTLYWRQAWSFPDQRAAEASLRNFISPTLLLSCLLVSSLVALFAPVCTHTCTKCSWDTAPLKATLLISIYLITMAFCTRRSFFSELQHTIMLVGNRLLRISCQRKPNLPIYDMMRSVNSSIGGKFGKWGIASACKAWAEIQLKCNEVTSHHGPIKSPINFISLEMSVCSLERTWFPCNGLMEVGKNQNVRLFFWPLWSCSHVE